MDQSCLPANETSHETAPEVDRAKLLQQAFLLGQLAAAGEVGKARGPLNHEMGAQAKRQLGLDVATANKLREDLAKRGYLATRKTGRQISYVLTEAGHAYFATLEKPAIATGGPRPAVDESAIPDAVREAQKAFLLLQLLDAEGRTLPKGQANRVPSALESSLGLKPTVANYRRSRLAEQGYIHIKKDGRSEEYVLAADGLDYLAACSKHLDHAKFTVRGATLNALVAAAQESSFQRASPPGPSGERPQPGSRELAEAVLAEFQELHREKYGRSGLVPIHEVRRRIAERFGQAAARHDVLDEVISGLWREGRLRMTAISDLRDADEQQLDDSIRGDSQTFFYLEAAHGQPATL